MEDGCPFTLRFRKKISESGEWGVWDTVVGVFRFRGENRDGVDVHGESIARNRPKAVALHILPSYGSLKRLAF